MAKRLYKSDIEAWQEYKEWLMSKAKTKSDKGKVAKVSYEEFFTRLNKVLLELRACEDILGGCLYD